MRRTAAPVTAGAAVLCGILLAGCSTDSPTPSPTTASTGPGASTSAPAQPSSPGPTSAAPEPTGTLGPNLDANTAAAFQLCGTSLALAAGFVGQVAPEQLAEGKTAVAAAREAYTDDGSGLLQIVDTLLAAVEDADQATVITSAQKLGDACQDYTPGT